MNDIERLYKKAGILPRRNWWCRRFDETSIADCNGTRNGEKECSKCEYGYIRSEKYPLFTAEKQLELIKWLSDTDYYIHNIYKTIDTKEYCIENYYYDRQADKFEEALASLINKLWQDLTNEEKQQIKEILE